MKIVKLHANLHCASCEGHIKKALKNKVNKVDVNTILGIIKVEYDENKIDLAKIKQIINDLDYEVY